jgi:transposase InsO family protein/transposase-like protein
MLRQWYKEYIETGGLHEKHGKTSKYTLKQKRAAVEYYHEHGRSIARTISAIGYPHRDTLREWLEEIASNERKVCVKSHAMIKYTYEQKKEAVVELCSRDGAAAKIAEAYGVSRGGLYKWKTDLFGREGISSMKSKNKPPLPDDKDALEAEIRSLKKQIYQLQMERDLLEKAAEILKKGRGINLRELANKEKAQLIDALRKMYHLNELLKMLEMSKSSYFYQNSASTKPDKYTDLRDQVKLAFAENMSRYGYRRVYAVVKGRGNGVSEKVIRRIMNEEKLVVPCRVKRKYKSYMGEITPAVENVIARNFQAEAPNTKWLTDLTEFHIPAGKVYLSPILDCFDGMIVSWSIGVSPGAELVNAMLDEAISCLGDNEHPIIHSDRGCHYRWPGWISRMACAGLTRSMSKKGCSPDNSACEGFFGRLKNEMFYGRSWQGVSIQQFIEELEVYLCWYNEKRIKISLGAMSPVDYRYSIGLAA